MYNRYIGNTGAFTRVEEADDMNRSRAQPAFSAPPPPAASPKASQPSGNTAFGLGGLLSGLSGSLKNVTGLFGHMPFGLDLGDILLFLLLFLFFLESGDEEFLVILAVIAFGLFKDR